MTTIKKYLLVLGILTSSLSLQAQSLEEALKVAGLNNPGLKANYTKFEVALQRAAQVSSLPDPQLSFAYFIQPVETRVGPQLAKISLSQMFPWFGTLSAHGEVAALLAQAKYEEFLESKNLLHFQVKKSWYQLSELQSQIGLQKKYLSVLMHVRKMALRKFENGEGDMVDVLRVDLLIQSWETKMDILVDNNKTQQQVFDILLNGPVGTKTEVTDTLESPKLINPQHKDSLLLSNPMLSSMKHNLESEKIQEIIAKKNGMPKLGLGLDYVLVGERNDYTGSDNGRDVLMPMVTISLPIYRKRTRAAVKQAQLRQKAISYSIVDTENALISEYVTASFEVEKAIKQLTFYDDQKQLMRQVIGLLEVDYSQSGKDIEEVLRMQRELLNIQMMEKEAIRDYLIGLARLDYLTAKEEIDE